MAQALVDHIIGETIGQAEFMNMCQVDRLSVEVLGFFQFGTIDVDHMVGEVLGEASDTKYAVVDHIVGEAIGQWGSY